MPDASSLGVTAGTSPTSTIQRATNNVVSSLASASNIGYLTADTSSLQVLSSLSPKVPADYYSFNFTSGSSIKLAANNLTNTADLRIQLYDSVGNIVADSGGTDAQKAAYAALTSSDGLDASTGKYTVKVGYVDTGTSTSQDYNLQLFSGTTYNSTLTTSALSQAYDPNLFASVTSTVTASASSKVYQRAATLSYSASLATATQLGTLTENQTALIASSTLNAAVPKDDFSFVAGQNEKIKLDFKNTTVTGAATLGVKVYDSKGNVIADSLGTDAQQYAYKQISSGAGLAVSGGTYTVEVGFKAGQLTSTPQTYALNLYSGTTYREVYQTGAAVPTKASTTYSAGDAVSVFFNSDAKKSSRQDYNSINATAADAINIGWLFQDKTSLHVDSRLTTADNADFYTFTLQKGDTFKAQLKNLTNNSAIHFQVLDPSGTYAYADNQGTAAQQKAFAALTSDAGLAAAPGQYVVKISYGAQADHSINTNYSFDLYSGSKYTAQYKTIASAQTLGNYLAGGGSFGYSAGAGAVTLLNNTTNDDGSTTYDVFSALSV